MFVDFLYFCNRICDTKTTMDTDILYMRMAYAALIFIFVFCGVLRCFDFWKSLGKTADDLYPARRLVACFYFSVVLLLPCVVHPLSADAQLLARCFWVLFVPTATSLAYKRFFYGDKLHKQLRMALVGGIPLVFALVMSTIAMAGNDILLLHKKAVVYAVGILGALLTAYEIHVEWWLLRIMSGADTEARAADRLFPARFARIMLWVSSLVLAVTWVIFLFGSMFANAVFTAAIALVGLGVLITILHPQRVEERDGEAEQEVLVAVAPDSDTMQVAMPAAGQFEACVLPPEADGELAACETGYVEEEADDEADKDSALSKEKKFLLTETQLDSMELKIRTFVEGKKQYLDPKLTRKTLEDELGVNRFYLSEVFTRRFGSLSLYLNSLRMEHAIQYAAEHPEAKQPEVIHRSGFGSNNSYYRAKKAYEAEKTCLKVKKGDNTLEGSDLEKDFLTI